MVYLVNYWYIDNYETERKIIKLPEKYDDSQKNVILLGNSHVNRLNYTFINEYLQEKGFEHTLYRSVITGSRPYDRLPSLDCYVFVFNSYLY